MKAIFAIVLLGAIIFGECKYKWPRKYVTSVEEVDLDNGCYDIVPGLFCQRFTENGFCYDPRYQNIAKRNCIASCGNCPDQQDPTIELLDDSNLARTM